MKNSKIIGWAVADAFGIFVYISIIALFFFNVQKIFGNKPDTFTSPLLILLLFVISAVITGSLFLGRPLLLYFDNMKREAITMFLYTLVSLVVISLLVLVAKILFFV